MIPLEISCGFFSQRAGISLWGRGQLVGREWVASLGTHLGGRQVLRELNVFVVINHLHKSSKFHAGFFVFVFLLLLAENQHLIKQP